MKRKRRTQEEIARLLADYHRSGLSVAVFANRNDVPVGSLYKWLRNPPTAPAVVEVAPGLLTSTEPLVCEFRWPDGRRFRFPAEMDAAALAPMVRALRTAK